MIDHSHYNTDHYAEMYVRDKPGETRQWFVMSGFYNYSDKETNVKDNYIITDEYSSSDNDDARSARITIDSLKDMTREKELMLQLKDQIEYLEKDIIP